MGISQPGSGSGGGASGFDRNEHLGHSVMFINNDERTDVNTRHGVVARAAFSDYVVCMTCGGKVFHEHLTFGQAIVPMILDVEGAVVLGTLGKGDASAGKSAAWLLFDFTEDEGAAAQTWLDNNAAVLPSGKYVIEETPHTEQPF